MTVKTSVEIKALKPRKERYVESVVSEDDEGRPVPGLQIQVYPSGNRSFRFRYALPSSPLTLGAFPAVSLSEARQRHHAAARLVARGIDPKEHRRQADEAAAKEKARHAAEITVDGLVVEFTENHLREHRKDPEQAERLLNTEVLPKWGTRKANSVTRRDAVLLVRGVKKRAPVLANRLAALVVQLFGYAADEGHLEANPLARLRRLTKEVPRERKLSVEEIATLWKGLDERSSTQPKGNLKKGAIVPRGSSEDPWMSRALALGIKLLLVTSQRRGELLKARWDEFDLAGKVWTIPGANSKNGKEHRVPLSTLAIELLAELKKLSGEFPFLFPTAHSQRRSDKPMTEKALTRAAARNQLGLDHWTAHDLRRTAASHMNRLGIDALVVERILNHTLPKMMQTYNRHDYEAEMRIALDRWAAELRSILAGKSNVVAMPKRKARA